jgi:uncharacterized glyoxalase superfamily protein PhnB
MLCKDILTVCNSGAEASAMKLLDCYTLTVTPAHRDCAAFYRRWFAFTTVFEAGWITVLASAGERPFTIGFMAPDHPSTPPGPAVSPGDGTLVTLQVADAAAEHARLAAAGAPLIYPLTDEPWGQRRFALRDPAGAWVDVVEQTAPAAGWWERYG